MLMESFRDKTYLIPGLVNDVVLEIFLHFVAINWDGPFTLMVVCNNWRDLVLSNSRLWTWIMVDDSQPDRKGRAHVVTALSRDLPLQLVLKMPFHNIDGLLDTLPRCKTAFLDTSVWSRTLSRGPTMVTHEEFINKRGQYQDLHDAVVPTLTTLEHRGIEVFVESINDACFSYAMWTTYERVFKAKTLQDQLTDMPLRLITTLIFKDKPRRTPRRIRLLNIWPYLPSLSHLMRLELSDNLIGGDNPSTVPTINLPSLRTLSIDCATSWRFRTKGATFDLFSLLGRLEAPSVRDVILHGSVGQLISTLNRENDGVRPSSLALYFLSMESSSLLPTLYHAPILHQVWQLMMDFFDPNSSSVRLIATVPARLLREVQSLISFASDGCSLKLIGGNELSRIKQLVVRDVGCLDIVYREGGFYHSTILEPPDNTQPTPVRSFTVAEASPESDTDFPWSQPAQHVTIDAKLERVLTHTIANSLAVKVLDTCTSTIDLFRRPHWYHPSIHQANLFGNRQPWFPNLRRLRATAEVAKILIEFFDIRSLEEIVICRDKSGSIGPFDAFVDTMLKREQFMHQLRTLNVEAFPPWPPLLRLLSDLGGGITTVKLPGLPHPSILRLLVGVLCDPREDYMIALANHKTESGEVEGGLGCGDCAAAGWTCYEGTECRRFSADTVVSITEETYVGGHGLV